MDPSDEICDMADTPDLSERRLAWRLESSSWAFVWAWRSLRGGFVSLMWSLEWDCDRVGSGDGRGRDALL